MGIFSLVTFILIQVLGLLISLFATGVFAFWIINKFHSWKIAAVFSGILIGILFFLVLPYTFPNRLQYPFFLKTFGPADGPGLPLKNIISFFLNASRMERVPDIAHNPNDVPPPITRTSPERVKIELETKEVIAEMADGVKFAYWTYNGTVPGPFLRVREGDTVELTLHNNVSSVNHHNIDLHAVTGPGGGAIVTNVAPGESKTLTFKALNPGLYVYHCAHPNVATHMAHGMYGLILVEPKDGLQKVDKEFYIMQGEFYSTGGLGKKGLQIFDAQKMLDGKPEYIVFNGRVGGASGKMKAATGEKIRIFFGNGGVNLISSFHVIGEIFDRAYPEGAIGSEPHKNIQTTLVPAGGATIVEFGLEVPGKYILVDHALARLDRGTWGTLEATGTPQKEIYDGVFDSESNRGH